MHFNILFGYIELQERSATKPEAIIESGSELLARLCARPSLTGLESLLFADGPSRRETVELCGNLSSGKTLLLTQLIAKCILPPDCDGLTIQGRDVAVLLINTDHHFRVSKLIELMLGIVEAACEREYFEYDEETITELIITPSLENLTVVSCYDNAQFKITLNSLDGILEKNSRIGLIAVDSVSSFYWQDRETGGVWIMDQYVKNILKIIQKHVFQYKIVTIYTRPDDFASKGQSKAIEIALEPSSEKINYRINFKRGNLCLIETALGKVEVRFKIDGKGITWLDINK